MADLTADQVSQGLPAPAAAAALLGKSGALMMLFLLFLAVTSASSAQLVAVSSVFTFDIYQPYIKPRATAKQLFIVSHAAIVMILSIAMMTSAVSCYVSAKRKIRKTPPNVAQTSLIAETVRMTDLV